MAERPHAFEITANYDAMLRLFGSEQAIRREYKRVRDILVKRVKRAEAAGVLTKDTALYKYKEGVPTATGRSTQELLRDLKRMERTVEYQKTGSVQGIIKLRKKNEKALTEIMKGLQSQGIIKEQLSEDKQHVIENMIFDAIDKLRSMGVNYGHYMVGGKHGIAAAAITPKGNPRKSVNAVLTEFFRNSMGPTAAREFREAVRKEDLSGFAKKVSDFYK